MAPCGRCRQVVLDDHPDLAGAGSQTIRWSRPRDLLAAGPFGPETRFFLGTVRPDGRRDKEPRVLVDLPEKQRAALSR